jgi:hypothetical protein
MTKEQARNSIIKLNANDVMKQRGYTEEMKQEMIQGEIDSYYFDVTEYTDFKRIGFVQWDRNIGDFISFCVPEFLLEEIAPQHNSVKWQKLGW